MALFTTTFNVDTCWEKRLRFVAQLFLKSTPHSHFRSHPPSWMFYLVSESSKNLSKVMDYAFYR